MSEITPTELAKIFNDAASVIDAEVSKVVRRTAGQVRETQRQNVPKRTKRTMRSIQATGPDGKPFTPTTVEAEVGPTWYVGRFIELGTATTPPRPFIANSYDPHAAEHEKGIQDAMTVGALKGL